MIVMIQASGIGVINGRNNIKYNNVMGNGIWNVRTWMSMCVWANNINGRNNCQTK